MHVNNERLCHFWNVYAIIWGMLATKLSCQSGACSSSLGATGGRRDEYTHGCVRGRERRSGLVRGKTEEFCGQACLPPSVDFHSGIEPHRRDSDRGTCGRDGERGDREEEEGGRVEQRSNYHGSTMQLQGAESSFYRRRFSNKAAPLLDIVWLIKCFLLILKMKVHELCISDVLACRG